MLLREWIEAETYKSQSLTVSEDKLFILVNQCSFIQVSAKDVSSMEGFRKFNRRHIQKF